MALPKECQALFSRWCADRVTGPKRATLQVGYLIRGELVTIVQRRPPSFPELTSAWSSTPIARLRHNDPEPGLWRLYQRSGDDWVAYDHPAARDPEPLLAEIAEDPRAIFWPKSA